MKYTVYQGTSPGFKLGIVRLGKAGGKTKYALLDERDICLVETHCFEARLEVSRNGNGARIYAFVYDVKKGRSTAQLLQDLVWQRHNGGVAPGFRVTHLNGITVDNRIDNLTLISTKLTHERLRHKRASNRQAPTRSQLGTVSAPRPIRNRQLQQLLHQQRIQQQQQQRQQQQPQPSHTHHHLSHNHQSGALSASPTSEPLSHSISTHSVPPSSLPPPPVPSATSSSSSSSLSSSSSSSVSSSASTFASPVSSSSSSFSASSTASAGPPVATSRTQDSSHQIKTREQSLYWVAIQQLPVDAMEMLAERTPRRVLNADGDLVNEEESTSTYFECRYPPCTNLEQEFRDFSICGRCQFARYCGTSCQQRDWPAHKRFCTEKKRPQPRLENSPER